MSERKEYELIVEDYQMLLKASQPTRAMFLSGGQPMGHTPQENANYAWHKLGYKMNFYATTVKPSPKGDRFFTAVPRPVKMECQCGYVHEIVPQEGKHNHVCPDCGIQVCMDGADVLCEVSYGDK